MIRTLSRALLAGFLAAGLAGCNDDQDQAKEMTQDALNIDTTDEVTTGDQTEHYVLEKDVKLIKPETGKVLAKEVDKKPVEVEVKTTKDVDINVGDSATETEGDATLLDKVQED